MGSLLHGITRFVFLPSLAITIVLNVGCSDSDGKGTFFGPDESPMGKSYAAWAEDWWKWALAIPCDCSGEGTDCSMHPFNDTTGELCDAGDQPDSNVWFLSGASDVTRDQCPIPSDRALFFPSMNGECPVPDAAETASEAAALCKDTIDGVDEIRVEVDGEELEDPFAYRAVGEFSFDFPDCNVFDESPGLHEHVPHDGYWYMVRPLPPGEHTLKIFAYHPPFDYTIDTTYIFTLE